MDGTRLELTATGVAPVVAPKARTSTWSALVVPVVVDMPTVDRTDVEVVPGGALVRIGGRPSCGAGRWGKGRVVAQAHGLSRHRRRRGRGPRLADRDPSRVRRGPMVRNKGDVLVPSDLDPVEVIEAAVGRGGAPHDRLVHDPSDMDVGVRSLPPVPAERLTVAGAVRSVADAALDAVAAGALPVEAATTVHALSGIDPDAFDAGLVETVAGVLDRFRREAGDAVDRMGPGADMPSLRVSGPEPTGYRDLLDTVDAADRAIGACAAARAAHRVALGRRFVHRDPHDVLAAVPSP